MSLQRETEILDAQDQAQVICNDCGATLEAYRSGTGCKADLDEWCDGFHWIENTLGTEGA